MIPKAFAAIVLTFAFLFLMFFVWGFDQAFGILAYRFHYMVFATVVLTSVTALWHLAIGHFTGVAAIAVAFILALPHLLPAPSERLLVSALRQVEIGADASEVEKAVQDAYAGSSYEVPSVYLRQGNGEDRLYVTLLEQDRGNCTAITFLLRDGKVVEKWLSPD